VASTTRVPVPEFAAIATIPETFPTAEPAPPPPVQPVPARKAAKPATAKVEAPQPEAVPLAEPAPQRVALDVQPAPAAPPPVDRWTRVQQEISRCDESGVIERVFCVERVRHANCEGYWGQVPSCPGAQVVDYAR